MKKELILWLVYDVGKNYNKQEIFMCDSWKKVYDKRKEFLKNKNLKIVSSKVYELCEEKKGSELYE